MTMSDEQAFNALPPPPATFHFIGIGGIGMSGLARILTIWGHRVTGSDAVESANTQALRILGIPVVIGHDDPTYAGLADIVVTNKRAAANAKTELDAADAAGARIVKRGDLLGMVANEKTSIAVAGSHGKSTTSAMLAVALRALNADPSFAVGAILAATGTNAEPGDGPYMVVEADEFDRSFHGLHPDVAIVTSVAFDHPDIYEDQAAYDEAFVQFCRQIKPNGHLIVAGDDPGAQRVRQAFGREGRADVTVHTFGDTGACDWRLAQVEGARWRVHGPEGIDVELALQIPGHHNARNGLAGLIALHALGFDVAEAARALGTFAGISRRFEHKGEINGATIIDDYGHHPDEVATVLREAHKMYPGRRIVAVHQPHTYSRTHALMREFAEALEQADQIVLMDIYGVGEANEHGISSAHMASLIRKPVVLTGDVSDTAETVKRLITPGDVVMTIGAGDITRVGPEAIALSTATTTRAPTERVAAPPGRATRASRAGKASGLSIPDAPHLKVIEDANMSLYTTMRIGGPAQLLVRCGTPDDVIAASRWARDQGLAVTMIGGGSNLLVSDEGLRGLVIVARSPGERATALLTSEDRGDHVEVTVGAQAPLSWVGRHCAEHGWEGMDWGVGLPGQIGGATVNNAGAHGTELKDHLIAVEILLPDGTVERQPASWMESRYRMTRIKAATRPRPWTVLRSTFRLPKGDPVALTALADEHADFRRRTQPTGACSGSTFANPENDFAGRLIEAAGLKGFQLGAMQMSPKHANWAMNTGNATAEEAWTLIQHVRNVVEDQFGVALQPEVERVGAFSDLDPQEQDS